MKKILLSKNTFVLVDDDDYEDLKKYKWFAEKRRHNFYADRCVNHRTNKREYMHRRIMKARKGQQVDHINGNGLDNRKVNMRLVGVGENQRNMRRAKNNTSGVTGVRWFARTRKWHAYIQVEGRQIHLGYHQTLQAAAEVRRRANEKYKFHENHGRIGLHSASESVE